MKKSHALVIVLGICLVVAVMFIINQHLRNNQYTGALEDQVEQLNASQISLRPDQAFLGYSIIGGHPRTIEVFQYSPNDHQIVIKYYGYIHLDLKPAEHWTVSRTDSKDSNMNMTTFQIKATDQVDHGWRHSHELIMQADDDHDYALVAVSPIP